MKMRRTGYWDSGWQFGSVRKVGSRLNQSEAPHHDDRDRVTSADWQDSRIYRSAVAVSKRGSETLPMSWVATGKVGKGGRMEGGKKSEGVSQARKRRGFTVYATGVASMEEDRNSLILSIFYRWTTKTRDLYASEKPFGCMLFNYFNIFKSFKCFKGAMRPRHTYVCGV